MKKTVSAKTLRAILRYNKRTGIFRWKIRPRQRACSVIAGTVNPCGYRQICIAQRIYKAHRVAWFYVNGRWPKGEIDHINGDRDDNRMANLRLANKKENQANSKIRVTNSVGLKGVSRPQPGRTKFTSKITVDYKRIWLGSFEDAGDAHAAYCVAALKYFGDFARAA